jgi:pimeloyl-ACP methyl ester carboxylesterase
MKTNLLAVVMCAGAFLSSTALSGCTTTEQGQLSTKADVKSSAIAGQTLDYEIKPGIDDNFKAAKFRLWLPDNHQKLRGVLTLTPGANVDGRQLIENPKWQAFAKEHNFALVSLFWLNRSEKKADGSRYPYYFEPKWGTGQALLNAIAHFAKRTGNDNMANLPMLLWGHSAGGQFNYGFASWAPERVIAFTAIKGGYYLPKSQPATLQVPALLFNGELDMQRRIDGINKVFVEHRDQGALWAKMQEPNGGHGEGHTHELIEPFFAKMMAKRLPKVVNSYQDIIPLVPSTGWLGDNQSLVLNGATDERLNNAQLSWLVDYEFAKKWQAFANRLPNNTGVVDYYTNSHQHKMVGKSNDVIDNEKLMLPYFNVYRDANVLTLQLDDKHLSRLFAAVIGEGGKLLKADFNSFSPANNAVGVTGVADNSLDSIVMVENYHQLASTDVDRKQLLAQLYKKLKPRGSITIIDNEGDKESELGQYNRIYRDVVADEVLDTGFLWDIADNRLVNKKDDLKALPAQDKQPTSKFIYRFYKPAF